MHALFEFLARASLAARAARPGSPGRRGRSTSRAVRGGQRAGGSWRATAAAPSRPGAAPAARTRGRAHECRTPREPTQPFAPLVEAAAACRAVAACSERTKAPSHSSASGTTNSAAAEGVGARTSAAKSAIVKSISWPMPLTTGIGEAAMARANLSSLKAHRSSREPPPRARISTSHSARRPARADGGDDLRGRLRTLHGNGIDQYRYGRKAPRQHVQDVADRRSAWAK